MLHKNTVLIILLLLFMHSNYAQTLDSLLLKSYKELSDNVKKRDSLTSFLSAKAYLLKAKVDKDTIKIANGYYFLDYSLIEPNDEKRDALRFAYNDSIIAYTKHLTGNKFFPSTAYSRKGTLYYLKQNYRNALNQYLLAIESNNNGNSSLYYLYHRISVIKLRFNKYKEALPLCKNIYEYNLTKKDYGLNNEYDMVVMFCLGDAYLKNKQLDSAAYFYDLGYEKSRQLKDKNFKLYFTLAKGVWHYYNKNYQAVLDSLPKTGSYLVKRKDFGNLSFTYGFLGKTFSKLGNEEKAILYFKKVDSIFNVTNDLHPDLRGTYPYLINHYKEKKDYKNQLKYTNSLLKLDSIYLENYIVIQNNLYEGFDQVNIRKEKKSLESILKKEKKKGFWLYVLLDVVLLIVGLLVVFIWRDKKRLKTGDTLTTESLIKAKPSTELSNKIKEELLHKLAVFEKNKGYLDPKIKISTLAKQLKTNTRYLSMVINSCKEQNFSQYINNLRIDYIITHLNSGTLYQKYSIEGIAKEIGFKNTESFSKLFLNKTGFNFLNI